MPRKNRLHRFVMAILLCWITAAGSPLVDAATVIIVNLDGAGEGFNDPTPAAPVGGNSGTTIGAQRLIAFQYAADIWGNRLSSPVPIRVRAEFNPLSCTTNSAVLGSAGPLDAYVNFTGGIPNVAYPVALASSLFGSDLDPTLDDIGATFASTIGTPGCLQSSGWYYGLDGNPGGLIDFVTVLIHELGHGLGFLTFVNLATGAKIAGFNDTFMRNLESHGASPPDYPSMSNAQRVAASISTGNLHWVGANLRAASGVLVAGTVGDHVRMFAPNPQQPGSSVSHFDTALSPDQIMEPSYTGTQHIPSLELPLFQDIGWVLLPPPGLLSVTKSGTGTGTVTSSPAGINCGTTCNFTYSGNTMVTLTATPAAGSAFGGWSGACTGTGGCVVTMNAARTVDAMFTAKPGGLFRTYLSRNGSDANGCTLAAPCRLLPEALALVASGGEVWMLDSANFNSGPVAIAKSVTILAVPGQLGSVVGVGGNALEIATAGVEVTLQNLNIRWLSGAGNGVHITNGSRVSVVDCSVFGFSGVGGTGIRVDTGANATAVTVIDTVVRDNYDGIHVSGNGRTGISRTHVVNNARYGVLAYSLSGTANAHVSDSVASGNDFGFAVLVPSAAFSSNLYVTRSIATVNTSFGFVAQGAATARMVVSASLASGNTIGFGNQASAATFLSRGDNAVTGNSINTSGTITPSAGN